MNHPASPARQIVFHEGEITLQRSVGAAQQLAEMGSRIMRDRMPQQHRDFFAQLPFLVIGALDADDQPWASVLAGPPGFAGSPHDKLLTVRGLPRPWDPLHGALTDGAPLGMLGIEPHTRRRNRLNGTVGSVGEDGFSVYGRFVHCEWSLARIVTPKTIAARPKGCPEKNGWA